MTDDRARVERAAQDGPSRTAIALGGAFASAERGAGAPVVSATGRGLIAEEIVALAERHGVPVERDPVLATLLSGLDVGEMIPPELYQAIAELLVFLYDVEAHYPGGES